MTKFETLVSSLRERIRSGEWKSDEQIPSRLDLAKECRVSPTTVSNAIRQLEKEGVVYVVSGKGVFVTPEERSHLPKHYTIGVRCTSWKAPSFGSIQSPFFESIWKAADACGSHVLLMASERPLEARRSGAPDGVIFVGGDSHPEALALRDSGFPVITCNRPLGPTPLNYVDFDNEEALVRIVRRFAAAGNRRIAVLSGFATVSGYFQKMKARFLETLSELELLGDFQEAYWRIYEHDLESSDIFSPARAEVKALFDLPEPPTAIFTWVPKVAHYILEESTRRGLTAGHDFSLASTRVDEVAVEGLSGFTLSNQELATLLLQEMIATIENPFHHAQRLVPLQEVEGSTVVPPPRGAGTASSS